MAYLLDTNVAIHLRDGDPEINDKVAALDDAVLMSIITRVELEGGVLREPVYAGLRRGRLDAMLRAIPAVAFDVPASDAYRAIVAHADYSRRKLLDRMIAAQAIIHHAVLVTMNPDDFADIVGLRVLTWQGPRGCGGMQSNKPTAGSTSLPRSSPDVRQRPPSGS